MVQLSSHYRAKLNEDCDFQPLKSSTSPRWLSEWQTKGSDIFDGGALLHLFSKSMSLMETMAGYMASEEKSLT